MRQRIQAAAVAALAVCLAMPAIGDTHGSATAAKAVLIDSAGEAVGQVRLEQAPKGVILQVQAAGLPPGPHGIHLHANGSCEPDFKAAKGHVNPGGIAHGLRHPDGPDAGDLPNLFVAADGSAQAEFYTTRVTIAPGGQQPALLDADGAAVIIHANADDHRTQPIGGAGGRIACGVIALADAATDEKPADPSP